jgi:hypothetical protein
MSICPSCFAHVEFSKAPFRCITQRDCDEFDAKKMQFLEKTADSGHRRYREYVLPRLISANGSFFGRTKCDKCGRKTAERACPNCHCELPSGFASGKTVKICILGRSNAGKTMYLSVLLEKLLKSESDFGIGLTPRTKSTQNRWRNIYHKPIYVDHVVSSRTIPYRENPHLREPLLFEMRVRGYVPFFYPLRRVRKFNLGLYDCAGEDTNEQKDFDDAHPALDHAEGIIVVLSAKNFPDLTKRRDTDAGYRLLPNMIEQYYRNVSNRNAIPVPTAFVISKLDEMVLRGGEPLGNFERARITSEEYADGFDLERCLDASLRITELVSEHGGTDLLKCAEDHYPRHMFFGVSSLGHTPVLAADGTEKIDPAQITPWNLFSPLFWLFYELGFFVRR